MSRFKVTEHLIGGNDTIRISDEYYNSALEIAQTGATLLAFSLRFGEMVENIIDGYSSREELLGGRGAKSIIMAPFSNKIRNNRYYFNGREYILSDAEIPVYHGLTWNQDFEIHAINITDSFAELALVYQNIANIGNPGYPFPVSVMVRYILSGNAMRLIISGKNIGDSPAPFSTGWHPYFMFPHKPIENYIIQIPAEKIVVTDSQLFPYPGAMACTHISNLPGSDFRPIVYSKRRVLGRRHINACYTELIPEKDGMICSSIELQDSKVAIHVKQDRGVVYCFTGDGLYDEPRKSIALEPVELMTNAFNDVSLYDSFALAPGESRDFHIEVEVI